MPLRLWPNTVWLLKEKLLIDVAFEVYVIHHLMAGFAIQYANLAIKIPKERSAQLFLNSYSDSPITVTHSIHVWYTTDCI